MRAATSEIRQFLSVLADGQESRSQLAVRSVWGPPFTRACRADLESDRIVTPRGGGGGGGGGGGLGRSFTVLQAIRMAYSSAVKMLVPVGSV